MARRAGTLDYRRPHARVRLTNWGPVDRCLAKGLLTVAVGGLMSGEPLPEQARPVVQAMAEKEGRVVLRCRPYETFAQLPATCTGTTSRNSSRTGSRERWLGTQQTGRRRRRLDAVRAVGASSIPT